MSQNRREFLNTSATLAAAVSLAPAVHASGSDVIRVGLVGCGGRGTGAAENALAADPGVRLTAVADVFVDKLDASVRQLQRRFKDRLDLPDDRRFLGFDAYKQLIDSDVDVVLLATPPHFRPMHLEYAVERGKHVFCEKPMAVDGPGVRRVMAAAEAARLKKLCLVSGFCYRYDPPKRELVRRIHDGAIGDVVALHVSYNTGSLWNIPRQPGMSDMTWQMRNWYYFTWLSGDHIVEQHVHNLDKAAWVLNNQYPVSATGSGGREVRTDERFGNIFDHHAVVFEYADGRKVFSFCRQIPGCHSDVSDHVMGSRGSAQIMKHEITGANPWRHRGPMPDMYQVEHDELFAAIRKGEPINDGEFMAHSTLMGVLGRLATYTGQKVTWRQALDSQDLSPPAYDWDAPLPVAPVAVPGKTKKA